MVTVVAATCVAPWGTCIAFRAPAHRYLEAPAEFSDVAYLARKAITVEQLAIIITGSRATRRV